MRLADSNKVLSERLSDLLDATEGSRLTLSKRMDVSDGTLGRIKYGQANPTLDILDRIAHFFRLEPWQLIKPNDDDVSATINQLASMATPRSRATLETISQAAEEGRLTDDDLFLLQHIAERFMNKR